MIELASSDYGFTKKEAAASSTILSGLVNAVTRTAQDVESYDRSTTMERIGYSILGMSREKWNRLNSIAA